MAIELHAELQRAMTLAVERHASDVFLFPGEPLSLRVSGKVQRVEGPVWGGRELRAIAAAAVGETALSKGLAEMGRLSTSCIIPGIAAGQLFIGTSMGEICLSLRMVPMRLPEIERLRLPSELLVAADEGLEQGGLMLISGKVGSGKTTTAFGVLEWINQHHEQVICTIEDPIAYHLSPKRPLILQKEIGTDVVDFAAGITSALQQDADVIYLGELRTPEDVASCVRAASLGRLVISQTHAPTAARAVQRLIDSQRKEEVAVFCRTLAECLRISVAQMLLPRRAGGQVAAYDVLVPDEAFRKAAATGTAAEGAPFAESIKRLLAEEIISPETAARVR